MANFTGTSLDDVMGSGTASAGTSGSDRWTSGAGNDTFVYELNSHNGVDRFSGGLGTDTVEFRLTSGQWNGGSGAIASAIIAFKAQVDARVSLLAPSAGGVVPSGTNYTPLSFGLGKSLTVLEAENVRVFADGVLVLGTPGPSTSGSVREAGVDTFYAPHPGTPVASGLMPTTDTIGNPIPPGSTWTVGIVNVGPGLSPDDYSKLGSNNTGFSIDKTTGQWTYKLDNDDIQTQDLQNGQVIKMSFQAIATDPVTNSATFQNVVITLHGTNDIQTINVNTFDSKVDERGGVNNSAFDIGDVDGDGASGAMVLTNVDNNPAATFAGSFEQLGAMTIKGTYGDLVITRVGPQATSLGTDDTTNATWSYTLRNNDPNVQALKAGQVEFDKINLPASKFDGATNLFTIQITGSDDAAVISGGEQDITVTEAGGIQNSSVPGDALAGGTFVQSDFDTLGPFTFQPLNANPLNPAGESVQNGTYGTFFFNPTSGVWRYELDNTRPATQALQENWKLAPLPPGEIVATETLTVSNAAGATKTITISVLPTDDLTWDITNVYTGDGPTVDEAFGGDTQASGVLTLVDVDSPATHIDFSGVGGPPAPVPGNPIVILGGTVVNATTSTYKGLYGDFTLTTNGVGIGTWTYTRNDGPGYLPSEELKAGEFGTDVMPVRSNDFGAFENVTVTIIGKDDVPTIIGSAAGTVVEAGGPRVNTVPGTPTATGTLTVDDEDFGQDGWSTPTGTVTVGKYGTFTFTHTGATGVWDYKLDNNDPDTEALIAGQKVTETLKLTTIDGTSQTVTVTVVGENDHAVISVVGTPDTDVKEFGGVANTEFTSNPSAGGQLKVVDVDGVGAFNESRFRAPTADDPNPLVTTDVRGVYGDFTFNPGTGAWTYTLNNLIDTPGEMAGTDLIALAQIAALQALADGAKVTDKMTVISEDTSTSFDIVVNVEGTYDVASIINNPNPVTGSSVQAEGTVRSNPALASTAVAVAADYTAGGNLDPIAPSTVDQYNAPGSLVGKYGVFTFVTTGVNAGEWTYTLDNEDPDTLALISGQNVQDFLTVSNKATPNEVFTIVVDVFGAHTRVDLKGKTLDQPGALLQTRNTINSDLVPNAAPVINGAGGVATLTFIVRNGEGGGDSPLTLHAGNPLLPTSVPWGTVVVNDGSLSTITMPLSPATQIIPPLGGVVNSQIWVWDGDTQNADPTAALNLGLSIAQGTTNVDPFGPPGDFIQMIGASIAAPGAADVYGGMASGYSGRDSIYGTHHRDFIDGGADNDVLTGHLGHDTIVGGGGNDDILGDTYDAFGNPTDTPADGNDVLWGGAGDDTINGQGGNDTLIGGPGVDLMSGGSGNNMYYFGSGPFQSFTDFDTITDFATVASAFATQDKLWFAQSLLTSNGYNTGTGALSIVSNNWFNTASLADISVANYQSDDRFIFDPVRGELWFDADGGANGPLGPVASGLPAQLVAILEIGFAPVNNLAPIDFLFTTTGP